MRHWTHLLATATVGLLSIPFVASAVAQSEGPQDDLTTWGVVPADADGNPDGRISFRHEVEPGETITEHAVVTNYSEQPVVFSLEGAPGTISTDGSFDVLDADELEEGRGSWITIQDTVDVEAASSVTIPFTIDVPEDALPGDHPAGIVVGLAGDAAGTDSLAVGFDARVGLRLHLRVDGEIEPRLEVRELQTRYETSWNPFSPGRIVIDYTVANAGNVRLASEESARVAGPWGTRSTMAIDDAMAQSETLPGGRKPVTTTVDRVWPLGPLSTTITARPSILGEDDLGDTTLRFATAHETMWAIPWSQLLLLVAAFALAVYLRRRRRRRKAAYAAALDRARLEGAMAASGNYTVPVSGGGEPRT